MGIVLTVKADVDDVMSWMTDIERNKVPTAASRAINKVLGNVRTGASKSIREERALKASAVKEALSISKATKQSLSGYLRATGRPIPLNRYDASKSKAGVRVRVSPGGRKLVVFAGNKAFQIERYGNNVFARTGPKRTPIKKLFGPSIPSTFLKEKVVAAMSEIAGEAWPKRFAEELRYELSKS